MVAVGRRVLRVELLRVLLRHGRRDRERQRALDADRGRVVELDHQGRVVRGGDAADVGRASGRIALRLLHRVVETDDAVEVRLRVTVRDARQQRALDRVLDVRRGHSAIDRGRELDVVAQLVGDRLTVGRDRRLLGCQLRLGVDVVRRVGDQRRLRRAGDHVAELVVRRARIDVVDVRSCEHRQGAALLGIRGRLDRRGELVADRRAGAAARIRVTAARGNEKSGRDGDGEDDQQTGLGEHRRSFRSRGVVARLARRSAPGKVLHVLANGLGPLAAGPANALHPWGDRDHLGVRPPLYLAPCGEGSPSARDGLPPRVVRPGRIPGSERRGGTPAQTFG